MTLSVGHYAKVLPLHSTLGAPRVSVDPATFLPPPLRKQAVGWYPEWGKVGAGGWVLEGGAESEGQEGGAQPDGPRDAWWW